jgi:putative phage-type endonuclease
MKIITIPQRTAAWHDWRNGKDLNDGPRITATSAVTIAGKSPWSTPHKLWLEMTGRAAPRAVNPAMRRGTALEPVARQKYIEKTGIDIHDVCIQHSTIDWIGSSLDGLSDFGDILSEIKVPSKADHLLALSGKVPDKYIPQVQWQLKTGEGSVVKAHYVSYYEPTEEEAAEGIEELAIVEVLPDPAMQEELVKRAKVFRQCVFNDVPPAGNEFEAAAHAWLLRKRELDTQEELLNKAKETLLSLLPPNEKSTAGGGVIVTRSERKGSVGHEKVYAALVAEGLVTQEKLDDLMAQHRAASTSSVAVKAGADAERVLSELDASRAGAEPRVHGINAVSVEEPVTEALTW